MDFKWTSALTESMPLSAVFYHKKEASQEKDPVAFRPCKEKIRTMRLHPELLLDLSGYVVFQGNAGRGPFPAG